MHNWQSMSRLYSEVKLEVVWCAQEHGSRGAINLYHLNNDLLLLFASCSINLYHLNNDLLLLFASCSTTVTNNNTKSTVYATVFINLGYTTCFDPNGSSSGVSSYILFTYWIAT
jgi:hypothetical protein